MSNFKFQIQTSFTHWKLQIRNCKLEIPRLDGEGFSFPELLITMGIIVLLLSFATFNLLQAQRSSTFSSSLDTLVSDIKAQQIKAMTGETEGRQSADSYGVYFSTNQYTLFHGTSFNPNDSSNLTITLDPSLSFSSNLFPSQTLDFQKESGEVNNFNQGANSIAIQTVSGSEKKTITINKYGVIVGVQ